MNTFLICALVIVIAVGWRSVIDAVMITVVVLVTIFVFLPCMVAIEVWRWVMRSYGNR